MEPTSGKEHGTSDERLGQEALKRGFIRPEQLREAISEQAREVAGGRAKPRPLANILISKGFLATEQLMALRDESHEPAKGSGPKYAVKEEIARGGMGAILRAADRDIRRDVAMKVMIDGSDEQSRARFLEEAQVAGQLEHPNIVPVHELGTDTQGRPFFTMKLVKGRSLADILKMLREGTSGDYTLGRLLSIFTNVCNGIAFAHSKGVVHRDLKPANIMVGDYGEVLVMDWGLAKVGAAKKTTQLKEVGTAKGPKPAVDEKLEQVISSFREGGDTSRTLDGAVMGTPCYMPPEQARGDVAKIDERSDVYSLGAILYEILTLKPPVEGTTIQALLRNVAEGQITPPERRVADRSVPKELSAVAMKALAKEQADRYATAEALRRDVALFLEGRAVSAKPDTAWETLVKLARRNRGASVATSVAALLILGILGTSSVINLRARQRADESARTAEAERAKSNQALSAFKDEQLRRIDQQKNSAPAFLEAGRKAIEHREWGPALLNVEAAIGSDPDLADARLVRSKILIAKKGFKAACDELNLYTKLKPDDAEARELAGICERAIQGPEDSDEVASSLSAYFLRGKEYALAEGYVRSMEKLRDIYKERLKQIWPWADASWSMNKHGKPAVRLGGNTVADLTALKGMLLGGLDLNTTKVSDLSPLQGMPLEDVTFYVNSSLSDCRPLKGCPIRSLNSDTTGISDLDFLEGAPLEFLKIAPSSRIPNLNPLKGAPLKHLHLTLADLVTDLGPLEGAPLTFLNLTGCRAVRDIHPLRDLPIAMLYLTDTRVSDIAPARGMPLIQFTIEATEVSDLSPLEGMKLDLIRFSPARIKSGLDAVRRMKSLKTIGIANNKLFSPEEFWKKYDAGEFK